MNEKLAKFNDWELIDEIRQRKYALSVWQVDDILYHARDMDEPLYKHEAEDLISIIDNDHDCNVGISWDVISCHIDMYRWDNKFRIPDGAEVKLLKNTWLSEELRELVGDKTATVRLAHEIETKSKYRTVKEYEYTLDFGLTEEQALEHEVELSEFTNDDIEMISPFEWEVL